MCYGNLGEFSHLRTSTNSKSEFVKNKQWAGSFVCNSSRFQPDFFMCSVFLVIRHKNSDSLFIVFWGQNYVSRHVIVLLHQFTVFTTEKWTWQNNGPYATL